MHRSSEDQAAARYVDGMGYDGRGVERVIFEASPGQYDVNTDKIIENGTTRISSVISMLKEIASSHLNAEFDTFLNIQVFGIQSVKTDIILSEMLFREDGRYHYREARSAKVPTEYVERSKWIEIFEILCYLFVELKNQEVYYQVTEDEEQEGIVVTPENTLNNKIKTTK